MAWEKYEQKEFQKVVKKIIKDFFPEKNLLNEVCLTIKKKEPLLKLINLSLKYEKLVWDLKFAKSDGFDDMTIKEIIDWGNHQSDYIKEAEKNIFETLVEIRECVLDIFDISDEAKEKIKKLLEQDF